MVRWGKGAYVGAKRDRGAYLFQCETDLTQ